MSILSIQSHVVYGYVGNKAATYPLQNMGFDVWPIHTVQFSNHTGYGKWQGEIFSGNVIENVVEGIFDIGKDQKCKAVISGYMGSRDICESVLRVVKKLKARCPNIIYLCDPVIGNKNCFVKPEVLDFFKTNLVADIITPNQFEAEILSGIKITNIHSLKQVADFFHDLDIEIVVITGVSLEESPGILNVFVSNKQTKCLVYTKEYKFNQPVNGTGDLFSSLFLGNYLKTKNVVSSIQNSVYFMEKVLENTYQAAENELAVLSVKYDNPILDNLPKLYHLDYKYEAHTV